MNTATAVNRLYPAEFVYSSVFLKGRMATTGVTADVSTPAAMPRQRRKQGQGQDMEMTNNNRNEEANGGGRVETATATATPDLGPPTYSSFKDNDSMLSETENDIDPFSYHLELSHCQKFCLFLGSITIAPIRLILYLIMFILATSISYIGQIGLSDEESREKLLTGWRSWLQEAVAILIDFSVIVMGFHKVTVKGQMASPKEAPILACAPHSSIADLIPIMIARGRPVAKAGICPPITRFMQVMLVNRSSKSSRKHVLEDLKRRAEETQDGRWPHTLIFPEGTCTNAKALVKFKIGAFYPGLPVQPVLLRPRCVPDDDDDDSATAAAGVGKYRKTGIDTLTWTWNQNYNFYWCFWLTLCQPINNFTVEFLPVYHPSDEERANPELFASNVRDKMARHLGLPVLDVSFYSYLQDYKRRQSSIVAPSPGAPRS